MLKKLASKSGKSLSSAEKYWEDAKVSASKKFSKKDSHYWAYVASIVKKRMGVNESLRFKQFIKEEIILEVTDENLEKIKKDCSQFIKESGGLPAFRGSERDLHFWNKTRDVSIPRDSSDLLSTSLNLYLEDKFGYPAIRSFNRIYAAGDAPQLKQYGDLYYIFPVDKFNFVWSSEVQDATSDIDRHIGGKIISYLEQSGMNQEDVHNTFRHFSMAIAHKDGIEIADIKDEDFFRPIMMALEEAFEEYNYQNKNLKNALDSGNEITFQTKAYYALPCGEEVYEPDEAERSPPYKYWSDIRKNYKEIYARLT